MSKYFDPKTWTRKTGEAIQRAQELAVEEQHQQLYPIHVGIVLLEDQEGVAKQAVVKAGGDEAYKSFVRQLRKKLVTLPKVEPAPDEVYLGNDLRKVLQAAAK